MISSVLTTALTVSDMERSLAFYRDLLGFQVAMELPPEAERERWDRYHASVCGIDNAQIRVIYLTAPDGDTHLELIEYLRPKDPPIEHGVVSRPGTAIIALGTKNSEEAVAKLRQAGSKVLSNPVFYRSDSGVETKTTYFFDPDGNTLCLFETLE